MRPLRSLARSRFALALLLAASFAQQVGAVAHGVMLARAGTPVGVLHEICTSGGLVQVPGAPEPAPTPSRAGSVCDLCATAAMPALPWAPDRAFAGASAHRDGPAFLPLPPLVSPPQRAYRSRAPPVSLPA